MKRIKFFTLLLLFIVTFACEKKAPNNDPKMTGKDHIIDKRVTFNKTDQAIKKVYVPVYSNIYQRTRNDRTSLTSTLSIHNISETDTLFITRIDYFNTEGKLVEKYLESPIYVNTFETIEYVVSEADNSGGSGANFVIEWYGDKKLNPLFQAVMIGGLGNKTFSFTTEGIYFE
ncbi:DUF3124 domain-containing protein [Winogradskyella forsetii]|uniref:DUF3124 domain-containing protein n=1 Tax=Winogradskyella forsetii TaxID=2686077 RepID=UPI0015BFC0CA|nr:DUF3124 domain-containing protein [Winogradskyella forsetii]